MPAASNTDSVSILSFLKMRASSLISAIFKSLWVFSITLAASATLILLALCVPAIIISWYSSSTSVAILGVEPAVTFLMLTILCFLSPGLIRSGE